MLACYLVFLSLEIMHLFFTIGLLFAPVCHIWSSTFDNRVNGYILYKNKLQYIKGYKLPCQLLTKCGCIWFSGLPSTYVAWWWHVIFEWCGRLQLINHSDRWRELKVYIPRTILCLAYWELKSHITSWHHHSRSKIFTCLQEFKPNSSILYWRKKEYQHALDIGHSIM